MIIKGKAKVYGPFELANLVGGEAVKFLSLPFAEIRESNLMISTDDNAVQALVAASQSNTAYLMVGAELAVIGSVQGYETLLKRQFVRSGWGPLNITFGSEESYDTVFIAGRLFIGGKPGLPADIVFATPLTLSATVYIQPRT